MDRDRKRGEKGKKPKRIIYKLGKEKASNFVLKKRTKREREPEKKKILHVSTWA